MDATALQRGADKLGKGLRERVSSEPLRADERREQVDDDKSGHRDRNECHGR
jgi:hypothetical protein